MSPAISRRRFATLTAGAALLGASWVHATRAADRIHVAKSNPHSFAMTPLDVGMAKGFFAGLDIDVISFSSGAGAMEGLVSGAADLFIGSGTDMAFIEKGVPITAVAAAAGPPFQFCIIVPWDSEIKSADELRGKTIGVTSAGSMTAWFAHDLATAKGWGPAGIKTGPVTGGLASQVAALRLHQVDAIVGTSGLAFLLEERKQGRLLIPAADYVKDFLSNVLYATNAMVERDPDGLRAFLTGWFETIRYMRAHKDETVKIAAPVTGETPSVQSREYDLVMPAFSQDGDFPPAALEALARSFVDLELLPEKPDMGKLYTTKFLPPRIAR